MILERPLTGHFREDGLPLSLDDYEKVGGYQAAKKALVEMTRSQIINELNESCLRGRGGAGFPTGAKWESVKVGPDAPGPRYFVVDADEMEPGAIKDRFLLEGNPHQLLEGILIGSYTVDSRSAVIFVRREYTLSIQRLRAAIVEAYDRNYFGKNIFGTDFDLEVELHVSAGRYICGEGTALVNSLMGLRAVPNSKIPRQTQSGLWGKPTLLNNVETLCNVPHIISKGAEWFKQLSHCKDGGTKIYGVSGRVKNPGIWELPMGTPICDILLNHAGGMLDGYNFRAVIPGGASTEFLVAEHLDLCMDFDSCRDAGSRLGTGTMIILDDQTCPVGAVQNLISFFARESCGWCTPCREGLPWVADILNNLEEGRGEPGDLEILEQHTRWLWLGKTFCALAPGAMEPLKSALKFFREDFERHVTEKRCPWR